ncbi:MAG TPA: polyphosphate kinase 1 [Gemmatimonadales bacterium]|jgi:polyphosphate kinase|nr:polyphosphate kinase 1 [Gemmatimonadales bacterium]
MPRLPEFRCDLPTAELFARLVTGPLPHGLIVRKTEWSLYRDVYLDTPDNQLARRGISCRIRSGGDDRRSIALGIGQPDVPVSAPGELLEAEVRGDDIPAILSGDSEPASRLREVVDPARLESRLELGIERVIRTGSRAWRLPGRFGFLYDRVTVRKGRLTREFRELKVRRLSPGGPSLEQVARELERVEGLRPILQTKLARARGLLRQMDRETVIRDLDSGRSVALIVLDEGRVALVREGDGERLPTSDGAGEQAVRHGLAEWFGTQVGEISSLGVVPPSLDRPSVEVWLVRRLRRGARPARGETLEWVPVADLAQRVRTSMLRHPATLAALAVAGRSALFPEWDAADGVQESPPAEAEPAPDSRDLLDPHRSLLEFDARVLALAEDVRTPLLERLRYLSILSANLDEFYMGIGREVDAARVADLLRRQQQCIADCLARLAGEGYRIRQLADLDAGDRESLRQRFRQDVFPILTPRAITVSPGHPFPIIPALTLSLAIILQGQGTGPTHFAYLKLPAALPRFLALSTGRDLVQVEEIVRANLSLLYPGRIVEESALFRVTRKGDFGLDEVGAGDLLQAIEEDLAQRALNPVVRLEIQRGASTMLREMLAQELRFEGGHGAAPLGGLVVHELDGFMAPGDLRQLAALPVAGGSFPSFVPGDPLRSEASLWGRLRERDLLVHHPYEDFSATVLRVLEQAAGDPAVLALKVTLYRAGERSPVVDALVRAAQAGKEVAVFIELKASFEEARNIGWVKQLEQAGAQVVYGLVGLKNHAKVALVVRREEDGIRRYVHVGTGNYNPATARVYTDLGLLSADPAMADDLNDFFNQLTGTSRAPTAPLRRLLVAPQHLLPGLLERITREVGHARSGSGGRIRAKLNGLDDPEIIRALYAASGAGVEIDLVVRGICTLKPGAPGLSERIRVRALVGRFLEHARIYHFGNGGADEYLIGSADWRSRNLRRRVEVVTSVLDPACRQRLDRILSRELADPSGWALGSDGTYHQQQSLPVGDPATAQGWALARARTPAEEETVWVG